MARIILIEDNEQLRQLLAACLDRAGHEVWHTDNAGAAVVEAARRPADIVIADLMVPNHEALEELLARSGAEASPEIVAMSGAPESPGYARMAQRLGWSRVLAKPFRPDTLLELIDRVVAERRYRSAWAELRTRGGLGGAGR